MTTDMMMGERDLEVELQEKDEIIMSLRLNEHLLNDKLEISRRNMKKQLERITALEKENEKLKQEHKIAIDEMITDYKNLEKENEKLLKQINDCKDYNAILYKNCMQKDKRWLKRLEKLDEELEEYIKENAKLREMYVNDE